jgi:hypothetical protein
MPTPLPRTAPAVGDAKVAILLVDAERLSQIQNSMRPKFL